MSVAEDTTVHPQTLDRSGQERLRQFVARIERVEEEISGCQADRKDIYAEAKGAGYDTKALRQVIRLRKQDRKERAEMEQILDLYLHALGET